jgi:alpha-ketoglutarate-dependent taurine dioxygenase
MEKVIAGIFQESSELTLPVTWSLEEETPVDEFVQLFNSSKKKIDEQLHQQGAILFNGIAIHNRADFQGLVAAIGSRFVDYVDGNSPRTKLSDIVYTSTEYDSTKTITQHNELSYSANWPSRIFFCCIKAAATGGETPLADGRKVVQQMDTAIVKAIEEKGLIYIRNLHGGSGFGPSWQHTFETEDAAQVENYCQKLSMEYEWK